MNLTALLADLYRRCGYPTTPNTTETVRLTSFLNTAHRQLLGLPGLDSLRDHTITFASVVGRQQYGLPAAVGRIQSLFDTTSQIKLRYLTLAELREGDPANSASGIPDRYIIRGLQQVQFQPAGATGLWAVSSSASDVQNVFTETIRTGGDRVQNPAVVMTGVTRVALGGLADNIEVTKFYLSSAAIGAVDLYDAAVAGNQLARIPIGATYARYLAVQLYPVPASVLTYTVDYTRTFFDMVNGGDEPLLPEVYHWLLVEGALLMEWTKRDDDRRVAAERAYVKGVSALKYWANAADDDLPVSGRRNRGSRSSLGPWYPADRQWY